jgi:hypothetical protein
VEQMAESMKNGTFDWSKVDTPIQILDASNGHFLYQGHHRFLAAKLAGIELPEGAIQHITQSKPWPQPYDWANVDWTP